MRRLLLPLTLAACTHTAPAGLGELSGGTGGTAAPEAASSSSTGEPEPDLPPVALDVGTTRADPCGSVDILFVVDNSGSMYDDQLNVAASAPGFINAIETLGLGIDGGLHIGVVSTDEYQGNPEPCQMKGALVTRGEGGICGGPGPGPPELAGTCPGDNCGPYEEGHTYMTELDDLSVSLACAIDLAPGGGTETPSDAAFEALDGWLNAPGNCNDGFHRTGWTDGDHTIPRATLILIYITDEDDQSGGFPDTWVSHLEWIRGGSLHDLIFIGIAGGDCASDQPERLQEFADLLPFSYIGTICASDFSPIFAGALPTVADGCGTEWVPVP